MRWRERELNRERGSEQAWEETFTHSKEDLSLKCHSRTHARTYTLHTLHAYTHTHTAYTTHNAYTAFTHTYPHTYTHILTHTQTHKVYPHTHIAYTAHTHIQTHTYTNTHTHIQTNTYNQTHTHTLTGCMHAITLISTGPATLLKGERERGRVGGRER